MRAALDVGIELPLSEELPTKLNSGDLKRNKLSDPARLQAVGKAQSETSKFVFHGEGRKTSEPLTKQERKEREREELIREDSFISLSAIHKTLNELENRKWGEEELRESFAMSSVPLEEEVLPSVIKVEPERSPSRSPSAIKVEPERSPSRSPSAKEKEEKEDGAVVVEEDVVVEKEEERPSVVPEEMEKKESSSEGVEDVPGKKKRRKRRRRRRS